MRGLARLILAPILFTPSLVAAQEPVWEPYVADGDASVMVEMDRTRIQCMDGQLTVWLRLSYAAPVQGRRKLFRSAVALYALDCAGRSLALIRATTYSEPLGEGDVIDRWDDAPSRWQWRMAQPGSADEQLLRIACAQAPATVLSSARSMSPPQVPSS